jgi:drug/metabolite transporter (DMT)-like permease
MIGISANVFYAVGSRIAVSTLPGMSALGRTTLSLSCAAVIAGVVALAHSLWTGGAGWGEIGSPQVLGLVIYAIFGMAISFVFWLKAIEQLGIGISSLHMNASAFYVMIFAWLLGASWIWMQVFGALIVALGVLIAQGIIPLGQRRP